MTDTWNEIRRQATTVVNHPALTGLMKRFTGLDAVLWQVSRGRWNLSSLFSGMDAVELTTTGARSGLPRTVQVMAPRFEGRPVVVGSNWGQPRHPAWVHNLRADPHARAVLRGQPRDVVARELGAEEYERAWAQVVHQGPWWNGYRGRTTRRIPLFVLQAVPLSGRATPSPDRDSEPDRSTNPGGGPG